MSDSLNIMRRFAGAFGQEEAFEAVHQLFDVPFSVSIAADAAASTNTANTKLWSNPFDYPLQLVSVEWNTDAAVTVDGSNYVTGTLYRDDGADGTPVACASRATINTSTNIAADIDAAWTLVPANCVIAAGASIFRNYLKAGSGVQLPAHALKLRLRRA